MEINISYNIKEKEFYVMYYKLLNIGLLKKEQILPQQIEIAALLCAKPLSNTLMKYEAKNMVDSPKKILAKELSTGISQVSNLIRKLLVHGILVENEEEEFVLNSSIQYMRKTIKEQIKKGDFSFNYNINLKIK